MLGVFLLKSQKKYVTLSEVEMITLIQILRYLICALFGFGVLASVIAICTALEISFTGIPIFLTCLLLLIPGFTAAVAYKIFYAQRDMDDVLKMIVKPIQDKLKENVN